MQISSILDTEIAKVVEDIYTPDPDSQQRFPSDLTLSSGQFDRLVDDLLHEVPPPKQTRYAEVHRCHLCNVLLNLARSVVTKRWTIFFDEAKKYSKNELMHNAGFTSKSRTSDILGILERIEAVTKVEAPKHSSNSIGNLYYPNRELREKLVSFGLEAKSETSFEKVLIKIINPSRGWAKVDLRTVDGYEKIAELNEFARGQNWACKEAITRNFEYDPFKAGRFYTEFQNLPSRSHKIRQNTFINGEPVTEIYLNANHLRIFLAFNKMDVFGDSVDAYRSIADLAKVDRNTVKSFFTAALNCDSYQRARSAAKVPEKFGRGIMEAFERLYPKAQLFSSGRPFSLVGMQLEGEILRIAMEQLRNLDIFALPIHDAVAVNEKHRESAVLALEDAWNQVMHPFNSTAKTFVK